MRSIWFGLALLCLRLAAPLPAQRKPAPAKPAPARASASATTPLRIGLEALAQTSQLPLLRNQQSLTLSGAVGKGQVQAQQGDYVTLATLTGPGCLYRLWFSHSMGRLRITFDDRPKPDVDGEAEAFFKGKIAPFLAPLVGFQASGGVCYFPMPFQKSCRIEVSQNSLLRYQIQAQRFPPGTAVSTFRTQLSPHDEEAFETITRQWKNLGGDPQPATLQTSDLRGTGRLAPGESRTLASLLGPAEIQALRLRFPALDRRALRRILLRITWENAATPAVEVPLGDFFATAFEKREMQSLLLARVENEFRAFFPMPFRAAAKIELRNLSSIALEEVGWTITYRTLRAWDDRAGYFHAQWRRATLNAAAPSFRLLEARGRGHLVGAFLAAQGEQALNYTLGAERVQADDRPPMQGVSVLDAFNGAPWRQTEPMQRPLHGSSLRRDDIHRMTAYRMQLGDATAFQKRLTLDYANFAPGDYSGVAYWYQAEPTHDAPPIDAAQLTYPAFRTPNVQEGESLQWEGVAPKVRDDAELSVEASGGKVAVLTSAPETFTFDVPADDNYALHFSLLLLPGAASRVQFALDGNPMEGMFDLDFGAPVTAQNMGSWNTNTIFRLPAGTHRITLTAPPGKEGYLDWTLIQPSHKVAGVIEAERLLEKIRVRGKSQFEREDGDARLSGWSGINWRPAAQDAELIVPFSVANEGTVRVQLGFLAQVKPMQVSVRVDGAEVGTLDLTQGGDEFETNAVTLPKLIALTAGEHTLTLTLTNALEKKSASLLLDYLNLVSPAKEKENAR